MQTQGVATNLGGNSKFKSFALTASADLAGTSGAGAKSFNLFATTPGTFILYIRLKHSVSFSGGGLTAMTVSVGKSGGAADFFVKAFDVFQAVADGNLAEASMPPMGGLAAMTVTATFTPTGASCSAVTAGQVNIDVAWMPVTTPTYVGLYGSGQVL